MAPVLSQEAETDLFKNEKRNERYNAGIPIFSPAILPAYSPEMGFILTGGCLISFKTKRNNDYLRHSIFSILVNTDLKEGTEANVFLNSYWFDNRLLFNLDAGFIKRTDHFWGIGFERAEEIEQGDNTTRYYIKKNKISPSIIIKTVDYLYAGIKADFNTTNASELSDLMLEDVDILRDTSDLKTSGIGIHIYYDSRNVRTNTTKGFLVSFEGMMYNKFLAGKYKYQLLGIDYRHFLPLFRKGSTIAWQFNSTLGFGDMPWNELQKIGSPYELRGFFYGQYRDKSSAVLQLEYRHTFSGRNKDGLSRHGFVFWIGSGTVFPKIAKINNALFNTGIGYRFEIQPNNNLRIDLGFGTKNTGVYVNYSESF